MKRCVLMLAFASVALQGQDQPGLFLRKADPAWTQGLKQKLFDWPPATTQPSLEVAPNWTPTQKQWPFDRRLAKVQPGTFLNLEAEPRAATTCVVPLLVVPVNPNIDSRMILKGPKSKIDEAAVFEGLQTCPERR